MSEQGKEASQGGDGGELQATFLPSLRELGR